MPVRAQSTQLRRCYIPEINLNLYMHTQCIPVHALSDLSVARQQSPVSYMYSKGVISNGALGLSAERLAAITPPAASRPTVHQ